MKTLLLTCQNGISPCSPPQTPEGNPGDRPSRDPRSALPPQGSAPPGSTEARTGRPLAPAAPAQGRLSPPRSSSLRRPQLTGRALVSSFPSLREPDPLVAFPPVLSAPSGRHRVPAETASPAYLSHFHEAGKRQGRTQFRGRLHVAVVDCQEGNPSQELCRSEQENNKGGLSAGTKTVIPFRVYCLCISVIF